MTARAHLDQAAGSSRVRRHDINWVRILAVLLLIPFHTARIFNLQEAGVAEPFYAKSQALSWPLSHFINFLDGWHMPLLFVVAGAASWHALGFRSGGQYLGERFKRLLIPFIFGVLVIVPPQTFFGSVANHNYDGSFLGYWPHFFTDESDGRGYAGGFTPAHLWFISYLFIFAAAGLALLRYLRGESGSRRVSRLAGFCGRPGAIFLFAVPLLGASLLVPDAIDPNPLRHFLFFLAGYLMVADVRFQNAIDRHKGVALLLGIATAAVLNGVWASGVDLGGDHAPQQLALRLLGNLNAWLWIVAILGYGRRFLNVNNRVLRYANEAAYPFYILHQTVIVAIGFYVLKWGMGVPASFTFIAVASLVGSLAIYEVIVKRVGLLRFLFGMKQAPAMRAVVQREAEVVAATA